MNDVLLNTVRHEMFGKELGKVLQMAIQAAKTAKEESSGVPKSKERVLAIKLKAASLPEYSSNFDLFDDEFKIRLAEYLFDVRVDWDLLAQEVFEKMDVS